MIFDYDAAFNRNLGWTTEWEQSALRYKKIAIAGLGGVGGSHLLTLSRLGVGRFALADFDRFDVANLNRQAGANAATLGRPKLDVMAEMALAINPDLAITRFETGVTETNIDVFLDGSDLFVDGLDFFALSIRAKVFARCRERGIPAVTAAPIGMGVGFLAFLPGGQSFEQYFRLAGQPETEQYLRFLLGVAPAGLHRGYLVDPSRVDIAGRRGPSTAAACELCAGMVATQALKLLLGRGDVPAAPLHVTFDAYRGRLVRTRLCWGNAGPLQRLKLLVARRVYGAMAAQSAAHTTAPAAPARPGSPLLQILDAARWAPSGDNTQPWRFQPTGDDSVIIHVTAADPSNPYEYRGGEPVLLAAGMLLESLRVAASSVGRALAWSLLPGEGWRIEARFIVQPALPPSKLLAALPMRSVDRGPFGRARLTPAVKLALAESLGAGLEVAWLEDIQQRARAARMGMLATSIRLRMPETFAVHRAVVDWRRRHSPDGLPAAALGLNAPTLRLMRWGMGSWARMRRLNAVIGTAGASAQLDLWPGLNSAAFLVIRAKPGGDAARSPDALLAAGMHIQRFWLTATELGLAMQPALATLIFAAYGAAGERFTAEPKLLEKASLLSRKAHALLGPLDDAVFLARIGQRRGRLPKARSTRRPLPELMPADPVDRRPNERVTAEP